MVMSLCTDYEGVVKLSEDFNGADLRNVCTEAGQRLALSFIINVEKIYNFMDSLIYKTYVWLNQTRSL